MPAVDESLGGIHDCSSFQGEMYNLVTKNLVPFVKYMDPICLKNFSSDKYRFWFLFGRCEKKETSWISDTDWVILDYWKKNLILVSKIHDITVDEDSETFNPADVNLMATTLITEYYQKSMAKGGWKRILGGADAGVMPEALKHYHP